MGDGIGLLSAFFAGAVASVFVYVLASRSIRPASAVPATLPLSKTISEIKRELSRFENVPGASIGLELQDITIELRLTHGANSMGKADLEVPVFGNAGLSGARAASSKRGSMVTVTLAPPKGTITMRVDSGGDSIEFASLLGSVRSALGAAMTTEPRLEGKSVEIMIEFVLVQSSKIGGKINVYVLGVGAGVHQEAHFTNKISLHYINPGASNVEFTQALPP